VGLPAEEGTAKILASLFLKAGRPQDKFEWWGWGKSHMVDKNVSSGGERGEFTADLLFVKRPLPSTTTRSKQGGRKKEGREHKGEGSVQRGKTTRQGT